MNEFGSAFKQIRHSKKRSLRQVAGDTISPAQLSRFENGKNDLSATALFKALEAMHTEVDEFLFLVKHHTKSPLSHLIDQMLGTDIDHLEKMYQENRKNWQADPDNQTAALHCLILKGYMRGIDDAILLSKEEETFLHNFLFTIDIWGHYELTLFSYCSTLLSIPLLTRYTQELLNRSEFLKDIKHNQNTIHTLLLNGYLRCIGDEDFEHAAIFNNYIHKHFYTENETYFRIVYHWARGWEQCKQDSKSEGIAKMKEAISIFRILGCDASADYYQRTLDVELNN